MKLKNETSNKLESNENLNYSKKSSCSPIEQRMNTPLNRVLNRINIILILIPLICSSCATQTKSIVLGAVTGTLTSLAVNQMSGGKRLLPVMGIGLIAGGLSGKLIYDHGEDKKAEGEKLSTSKINKIVFSDSDDVYVSPRIEKRWIPARVTNVKKVSGHFEWFIAEPGHFQNTQDDNEGAENGN